MPQVSVVIPVYNSERYLSECLDSILNQTLQDIEVICVDDGSTDQSLEILNSYARADARIYTITQDQKGAGAARNLGFRHATGEYVFFCDSDDLCDAELLEKTVARATETQADIVGFDFVRFYEDGSEKQAIGVHLDWLEFDNPEHELPESFNYMNCPDRIMSIVNPTPWNKLYRSAFIRDNNLLFEEISSSNDITFAAVSVATAQIVAYIKEPLYRYRGGGNSTSNGISSTKPYKLNNVVTAITSAVRQAEALPYREVIRKSIWRFAIDNYVFAFEHYLTDFDLPISEFFYNHMRNYMLSNEFDSLSESDLYNQRLYHMFKVIRMRDYKRMQELHAPRLICSLTTFPARINGITSVLNSVYNQTLQPDLLILWLAEDQFPEKEQELPDELLQQVNAGKLTIGWCDDLKPHKKYFYTMKQYPDDIVITIDDDIIYAPSTFQTLYNSYLMHPNAVSAMRTNLITTSQRKEVLPYKQWINEADAYVDEPSMYLLATGVMGVLYPPKSISSDLFDKQGILDTCLFADDLWLKTMEMMNGTPVVLADIYRPLQYVPNSQETSLYQHNVDLDENDLQLNNIQNWIDSRYGEGTWIQKLTTPVFDVDMSDTRVICENFARRDSRHKYDLRHTSDRLKTAWAQKSEINAKLQKTYQEKFDRGVEIKQLKDKLKKAKSEKSEINAKLKAERAKNKKLMRYKKNMESKLVVRVYRKLKRIARKLLGRK